jgi:hypothetical protein
LPTTAILTDMRRIVLLSGRGLPTTVMRKVQRLALRRRCDHLKRAASCGCLAPRCPAARCLIPSS